MQINSEIYIDVWNANSSAYYDKGQFDKYYLKAVAQVEPHAEHLTHASLINTIIVTMNTLLHQYEVTTPKTKGGKVGRFFARLFTKIDANKIANFILSSTRNLKNGSSK